MAVVVLLVGGWMMGNHDRPRAFHEVEAGVFRSAQLEGAQLEGALRRHGIRTILRLNGTRAADPRGAAEDQVARALGVRVLVFDLPPQGHADGFVLDRLANLIADRSLRPILVHCEAGLHRTSAALAAYRLRRCGWTWEMTSAEIRRYGPRVRETSPFLENLREYGTGCSPECLEDLATGWETSCAENGR